MSELVRERRFLVECNYDGWRLDTFLAEKVSRLSRSKVSRIIGLGGVVLEPARRVKPGAVVRTGDVVVLRQVLEEETVQYEDVRILASTAGYMAFDKPAGMLVHPTARVFHNTLTQYALAHGFGDLNIVHRLDRETSGVVVLARGPGWARELATAFATGRVRKQYLAIVVDPGHRHREGARGACDVPLGFDTTSRLPDLRVGLGTWPATTRWRCVGRYGDLAELEVSIDSGRQHQIRAHLALQGTPLVGDKLYLHGDAYFIAWSEGRADASVLRAPRHALHAWRLELDTGGGQWARWEAPRPAMFDALMTGRCRSR